MAHLAASNRLINSSSANYSPVMAIGDHLFRIRLFIEVLPIVVVNDDANSNTF
jgi:hypothetical protein